VLEFPFGLEDVNHRLGSVLEWAQTLRAAMADNPEASARRADRGARVIAIDLMQSRLDLAGTLGADSTINSSEGDALAQILELTGGRGVHSAIDCSGSPIGQNLCLDAAAKLGAVAFVGESRATEINPSDQIIRKLLTVVGGWYFPLGEWAEIVRLVTEQNLPVEQLVTHRFPLSDAAEAFRAFDQRETEKAVFTWGN